MISKVLHPSKETLFGKDFACIVILMMVALCANTAAFAQFISGSDGSDGAYAPSTSGPFIPGNFHGTGVANNVFNFTTITIPAGVTITLTAWYDNQPVYFLATGNVDIEGTLNLNGARGMPVTSDPMQRIPAAAGSGGYGGGVGGGLGRLATAGNGPGGGAAGTCTALPGSGTFASNEFLIPLPGGSGGGGYGGYYSNCNDSTFGESGGAGGGAILIASSTQITVNGTLSANGGDFGIGGGSGAGSGGAIRLVSNSITGGSCGYSFITATGGTGQGSNGGFSRIRLEAYNINPMCTDFGGTPVTQSTPINNFYQISIPTSPQPSLQVTSINGIPITENPFTFPDITINTDQPVQVVIAGHQVPIGTIPILTILGESADQDNLQCPGGMQGTLRDIDLHYQPHVRIWRFPRFGMDVMAKLSIAIIGAKCLEAPQIVFPNRRGFETHPISLVIRLSNCRRFCDGQSLHVQREATTFNKERATGSISIS